MVLNVTLPGQPRTKKTSNRIVRFGKNREHVRVLPSELFEAWVREVMTYAPVIRRQLRDAHLPITAPVSVCASIYTDSGRGDLTGYLQAIGDVIQAPKWSKPTREKPARQIREGLGLIADDKLIQSWDGSRCYPDPARPRVELEIEVLAEQQMKLGG